MRDDTPTRAQRRAAPARPGSRAARAPTPVEGASASRTGVAAVDRALAILLAFRESETSIGLASLAQRTGLYKSTILRLIGSLEREGFVQRLPSGEYKLGPVLHQLGAVYVKSLKLEDFILPVLRHLVKVTSESGTFYVVAGKSRLCLYRVDSPLVVRDHVRAGDMLPLDRGAGGHVLRSFANGTAPRRGQDAPRFVVATFGERQADTAAVAAPVFGVGGSLVGALSVSGPRTRFTRAAVTRIADEVLQAARNLSRDLGADPDVFPRRPDLTAVPARNASSADSRERHG
jgi:DNA-binding IclR family transcriptional regulator